MGATATALSHRRSIVPAIVWGGFACGVLDLLAAFVRWGFGPRIPQAIASGVLGRASFEGGGATAALGVTLHFLIAFSAAAVFCLASRRLEFLTRRFVLSGFVYGTIVYLFMGWVVVPLSRVPGGAGRFSLTSFMIGWVTHLVCVGLPISVAAWWFSGRR